MSAHLLNPARDLNIGTSNVHNIITNNGPIAVQSPDISLAEARERLNKARAVEAGPTSKTASQATRCSPGTREEIIADIAGWVTDPDQTTIPTSKPIAVLWFSGPAGGGKTAIMRNVVDRCKEAGLFVVSYFFNSRANVTSEEPFVATISHQLADNPILEPLILQAMQRRPSLFDESLAFQLQMLVIEPLSSDEFRSSKSPAQKVVIAIDGFDECATKEQRKPLFGLLQTLVETFPDSIRIILASRPENDIRRAFSESLKPFTHPLDLTQYSGTEDTRIFMCDEFEKICRTHPMRNAIPHNWPIQPIMDVLVDKSSGLFILPSVLMKHLDNPRRNPVQALDEVLAAGTSSSSTKAHPLAELDWLYYIILHPPDTDLGLMRRLLHILLELGPKSRDPYGVFVVHHSTSFLDSFCFLTPGSTDITFCDLHSVLSIRSSDSSDSTAVTFHHKSMQDYLTDPNRSKDMHQPRAQTLTDILLLFASHLQDWEKNPRCGVDSADAAAYSYSHILEQLLDCQDMPKLPEAVLDFDPRIISQWRSVYGHREVIYFRTPRQFHEKMCNNRLFCQRLCRLMLRVKRMDEPTFGIRMSIEERIEALPQFRAGSGLYDPPDPSDGIWPWLLSRVKK